MTKNSAMAAAATREKKSTIGLHVQDLYSCLARFAFYCIVALVIPTGSLGPSEIASSGRVATIRTPNGGEPEDAKLSPDGMIHLLYNLNSEGIPYYVRSSDGGLTFSSPMSVVDKASRKPGLVFSGAAMGCWQGRRNLRSDEHE